MVSLKKSKRNKDVVDGYHACFYNVYKTIGNREYFWFEVKR